MQYLSQKDKNIFLLAILFMAYSLGTGIALFFTKMPFVAESPEKDIWTGLFGTGALQITFLITSGITVFALKNPKWEELGFLKGKWVQNSIWILATALVALLTCYALNKALHELLQVFAMEPREQEAVQRIRESDDLNPLRFMFFMTVVIAPLAEELFFRGVLFHIIKQQGRWVAYISISIIFGLLHVGSAETPPELVTSIVQTIPLMLLSGFLFAVYHATGNILAPILTHSLFNLAGFLMARFAS